MMRCAEYSVMNRKSASATEVTGKVVFHASDTTWRVLVDATILDAADEAGVSTTPAAREHAGRVASSSYRTL